MPSAQEKKWEKAKEEYEALTGKKKPSDKFLSFFRKASGIEPALKKCDAELNKKDADLKKVKSAIDEFNAKALAYFGLLVKAIDDEKKANADAATALSKGMSFLKNKVKEISSDLSSELKAREAQGGMDGMNPMQKMAAQSLATYEADVRRSLAGAKAAIKLLEGTLIKVEAGTTPIADAVKLYNDLMDKKEAGRKLATAFGAYNQIAQVGGDVSGLNNPAAHITALTPYANGARKSIAAGTNEATLKQIVKDFKTVVKASEAAV